MGDRLDLTGQTIGYWKVGDRVIGKNKKSYFECTCTRCGKTRTVKGSALTSGASKSCGCTVHSKEAKEKRIITMRENKDLRDGTSVPLIHKITRGELISSNTSGCTGVSKKGNGWVAEIIYKGEYHYLGYYSGFQEAVMARKTAEKEYYADIRAT